jgi:Protein of unknown function (DUF3309)
MSAILSSAILAWSIHGGNDWGYFGGGAGLLVVIVIVVLVMRR